MPKPIVKKDMRMDTYKEVAAASVLVDMTVPDVEKATYHHTSFQRIMSDKHRLYTATAVKRKVMSTATLPSVIGWAWMVMRVWLMATCALRSYDGSCHCSFLHGRWLGIM